MPFYNDGTIETMMALNSFAPRFDPHSIIPSYDEWLANNSFDPFGPEGVNVDNRIDRSCGPTSVRTTRDAPQDRSRFAFARKQIQRIADIGVGRAPAACACQYSASQMWDPAPTKAILATVPQIIGSRPPQFQHAAHTGRESTLAAPKAVHPLPTWLTRFEVYEEELISEFCPSSTTDCPPALTIAGKVELGPHSDRTLERPPLDVTLLLGFPDDDIMDGGWSPEEDEDFFDEWDVDYHPFELDDDSDSESNYGSVGSGSGSSTPTSCCWVDAFDWPSPSQGHASAVTLLDPPPHGSPSLPSSGPHAAFNPLGLATSQPRSPLPWSASTDPFSRATAATPPLRSSVKGFADDTTDDSLIEAAVDRLVAKMEEGLGFGSSLTSELTLDSYGRDVEGWCDWSDLTDYLFPVPPQRPQRSRVTFGFGVSPLCTTAIPSADTEADIDVELDAVVVSPRSPVFS